LLLQRDSSIVSIGHTIIELSKLLVIEVGHFQHSRFLIAGCFVPARQHVGSLFGNGQFHFFGPEGTTVGRELHRNIVEEVVFTILLHVTHLESTEGWLVIFLWGSHFLSV